MDSNPPPTNVVTPSNGEGGGEPGSSRGRRDTTTTEEEKREEEHDGFPSLDNPLFVQALDSSNNPVLCIESFFATIHDSSGDNTSDPSTVPASSSPAAKRHASAASKRNVATPRSSQTLFKFGSTASKKASLEMTASIIDDTGASQKHNAIALAANDDHALVCLLIDDKMVPATCHRESLPKSILKHIQSGIKNKGDIRTFKQTAAEVGKCKEKGGRDDNLFCILDEDSPFKNFVVDESMLAFLMNTSRVKKDVLDDLEQAFKVASTAQTTLQTMAVQVALGGSTSALVPSGRFVKCPIQDENAARNNGSNLSWSDTPCFCNLTEVEDCPNSGKTKRIIGRRLNAHRRKEDERNKKGKGRTSRVMLIKGKGTCDRTS